LRLNFEIYAWIYSARMGRNKGSKGSRKRKTSQTSPNSVSETLAKRLASDNTRTIDNISDNITVNMTSPQGTLPQGPQGPQYVAYGTPPIYPNQQFSYNTLTPMQSMNMNPNLNQVAPPPQSQNQTSSASEFERTVIGKLEKLETRLSKLDSIEKKLTDMSQKMTAMDNRVSSLETSARECNGKLVDLEVSRTMDAQTCDEIRSKQSDIDSKLKEEKTHIQKLSAECETLKKSNLSLSEEITDLQSRSMRDNLLFFGITEANSPDDRKAEQCSDIILGHLEHTFNIPDARGTIKLDRAHRIGSYDSKKTRPVVVKFNYYQDKERVKQHIRDFVKTNSDCPIRSSDQFPKVIQEKRKKLIPTLVAAKTAGKKASLSYDKLYIEGKMYTVDTVSQSGYYKTN